MATFLIIFGLVFVLLGVSFWDLLVLLVKDIGPNFHPYSANEIFAHILDQDFWAKFQLRYLGQIFCHIFWPEFIPKLMSKYWGKILDKFLNQIFDLFFSKFWVNFDYILNHIWLPNLGKILCQFFGCKNYSDTVQGSPQTFKIFDLFLKSSGQYLVWVSVF